MINLQLINFQDSVECKSALFTSKEGFARISHQFKGGNVYGIVSDFGCGSWGLVTCLGGRCNNPDGEVFLNGKPIACNELFKHSCFVSENIYNGINSAENYLTPEKCIEKALQISGLPYDVETIRSVFGLSGPNERFKRDLRYVSGEIWLISIAIGYASNKKIFCFPWLNERDIDRFDIMCKKGVIKTLKESGKIILVPSNKKKVLKKWCNELVCV